MSRYSRSTGQVQQPVRIAKEPGIANNPTVSGAAHGPISWHSLGVVCQTMPALQYRVITIDAHPDVPVSGPCCERVYVCYNRDKASRPAWPARYVCGQLASVCVLLGCQGPTVACFFSIMSLLCKYRVVPINTHPAAALQVCPPGGRGHSAAAAAGAAPRRGAAVCRHHRVGGAGRFRAGRGDAGRRGADGSWGAGGAPARGLGVAGRGVTRFRGLRQLTCARAVRGHALAVSGSLDEA